MKNLCFLFALLCVATSTLILAPGCASTPTSSSTGEYIDDSVITTKVKTALIRNDATPGGAIKVETFKGVVQLSGFVDTVAEKSEAGVVAAKVEGVKNVSNDIIVSTTLTKSSTGEFIDDSVITTKVKAALVHDAVALGTSVKVDTLKGVVQLSGFVDTVAQKSQAGMSAAKIEGVKDIRNDIVVK
ncbi:MAG TPA: BON domain-containing protein [Lacunisphaera sp.]|jgi:hyperosmotically inducible protein